MSNDISTDPPALHDSFTRGFGGFFSSLKMLSRYPGMAWYFLIPFILNILVLSLVFWVSYTWLAPWVMGLVPEGGWLLSLLRLILKPLLFVILLVLTVSLYQACGCLLTGVFCDFLSEKVEQRLTGIIREEPFSLFVMIKDAGRILFNSIRILGITLLITILLLPLNLIPVVGSVAYIGLSVMSASFFFGFQFFDLPMERRRLPFGRRLSIGWRLKRMYVGVGLGFFLVSFIPFVGFLGMNLGTLAGTELFVERILPCLPVLNEELPALD